ncbi:MAG: hypothetical protein GY838_13085 [bacterium]|nr:hypothetical protein [bacterium]
MNTTTLITHKVQFYGHSDDCFEIEGAVSDEGEPGVFQIKDPAGQRINLVASYGQHDSGMWMLGLQVADDDDLMPDWEMRWGTADNKYSPLLELNLPEGTTITRVYPEAEKCEECQRSRDPESWTVGAKR